MQYRILGRTGLSVSIVGVGGGGIGQVWGPTTDEECIRTVQRAYELGVNFFDVAPSYGDGKAEEILGQAARPFRQQVFVAPATEAYTGLVRTAVPALSALK